MGAVNSPEPAWRAIARDICDRIDMNETPVGTAIASGPKMRARYQHADKTIRRAVDHLKAVGVLEGRHGSGVYVARKPMTADLEERPVVSLADRVADHERRLSRVEELLRRPGPG